MTLLKFIAEFRASCSLGSLFSLVGRGRRSFLFGAGASSGFMPPRFCHPTANVEFLQGSGFIH